MEPAAKRGMTLVELVIVLAIVAILAGMAWPGYVAWRERQWRLQAIEALFDIQLQQARTRLHDRPYLPLEALHVPQLPPQARLSMPSVTDAGYLAVVELPLAEGERCRRYAIGPEGPVHAAGFAGPDCWIRP